MSKQVYIIPDMARIDESLALAGKYGAAFEYNEFMMPNVLNDEKRIEEIIEFYKGLGRDISKDTMHGAFLDVVVHSEDSLIREVSEKRIRQSMEIAKRLGVRGVIVHTGRIANFRVGYYINHWIDTNEAFFRNILNEYPNIEIYMENMFDEAADIMARLAERMKDEERFGVCLDYAHSSLTDRSAEEWVETLRPYIRHIHINDNDMKNDLHGEIGKGKIEWNKYNELMRKSNINASVLVEIKDIDKQRASLEFMTNMGIYPFERKN